MSVISSSLGSTVLGTEFNIHVEEIDIDPGVYVEVFSFTVPVDSTLKVSDVGVSCSVSGRFQLLADGEEIASGRTTEGKTDAERKFGVPRPISSGTLVELKFRAAPWVPHDPLDPATVDGFLDALDT